MELIINENSSIDNTQINNNNSENNKTTDTSELLSKIIEEKKETSIKNNKVVKKNKKEGCQELKNIAYKTMLLNGTDINPKQCDSNSSSKISNFLEDESNANKRETWAKLDKTQKILKLNEYTTSLKEKHILIDSEIENLKKYFIRCLDRKCLIKSKEVIYDKNNGSIVNIPFLFFNENTRSFILKKDDKHVSTIKSLPQDKKHKTKTVKTCKNN